MRWVFLLMFLAGFNAPAVYAQSDKFKDLTYICYELLTVAPDSVLNMSIELRKMARSPQEQHIAYSVNGLAHTYLGAYDQGILSHRRALNLIKDHGTAEQVGNVYNNLGMCFDYMGQYDSALYYYYKGLDFRQKDKDKQGVAGSHGNLGLVYYYMGKSEEAIEHLHKSYDLASTIQDSLSMISAHINLSLVYEQNRDLEKAIDHTEKAMEIARKSGNVADEGLCLSNLATYLQGQERYEEAKPLLEQALIIHRKTGDLRLQAIALQNMGAVNYSLGDAETAIVYADSALELAAGINEPVTYIEVQSLRVQVLAALNRLTESEQAFNSAMEKFNKMGSYVNVYELYAHGATLFRKKGDFEKALKYYTLFREMKDSIQNDENRAKLNRLVIQSEYERQKALDEAEREKEKALEQERIAKRELWNIALGVGMVLAVALMLLILRNNRQRKRANQLLQHQNNEIVRQNHVIEQKNKDITDSIEYASRYQQAILPSHPKLEQILGNYGLINLPRDIVGGDFFWCEGTHDDFLLSVIDCTGHGVPGGFMSIVAQHAIHQAVMEHGIKQPAAILDKVNHLIESYFTQQGTTGIRDGMDLILIRVVRHANGATVSYAGAHNPLWMFLPEENKPGAFRFSELKADKQPIGVFEDRKPFSEQQVEVHKGAVICLSTDGYGDQFGGPRGKKMKNSAFRDWISAGLQPSLQQQAEQLTAQFHAWKGELEQLDDVCVILFEV
jgi:serine phosphatase RsbU (regulator of sigma subunit)/Tfp pilus assembly protein PilF